MKRSSRDCCFFRKKDLQELVAIVEKNNNKINRFKSETNNFRFAILVDMWTTGFDTPQVFKMYLVKPISGHTLIQTVSRVTRTYKDKEMGIVIDYLELEKNFSEAFRMYTSKNDVLVLNNNPETIKQTFNHALNELK